MKVLSLFLGLSLILAGCSASSNSESKSVLIGDKTPTEYYDQFIFEKNEDGTYRLMKMDGSMRVRLNEDGSRRAELSVKFFKSPNHFQALYEEGDFRVTSFGSDFSNITAREFEGTWLLEDSDIILSGLGRGVPLTLNDRPAIVVKLSSDIISAGVSKRAFTLQIVKSTKPEL